MPTFDRTLKFREDYRALNKEQQEAFKMSVRKLVEDLQRGDVRKGLRIKRVRTHPGIWEMTWADDGRATFEYGESVRQGHAHVIWRRIGSYDILDNP